jgi:hypothetical protein
VCGIFPKNAESRAQNIQMIGAEHSRLPGEGRDPFLPWAPAFAGVDRIFDVGLGLHLAEQISEWV